MPPTEAHTTTDIVRLSSSSWCADNKNGWGAVLHEAACAVDTEHERVYVHGGRIPSQRNAVSCGVFRMDLTKGSSEPVPLYSEDDALRRAAEVSRDAVSARDCPGPARYGHILVHHDAYLVTHGGKDAFGVTQSDLHGFHLDGRRWMLLKHAVGGCAPPRMSGHHVTPLGRAHPGVFVVVGVEQRPHLPTTTRRTKRVRDAEHEAHCVGGAAALSVFCLDLADFQRGWSRVASPHAAKLPRMQHIQVFTHRRDDDPADKLAYTDLFVLGQVRQPTPARTPPATAAPPPSEPQLWRLQMGSGAWQQIDLGLHTTPGPSPQPALSLLDCQTFLLLCCADTTAMSSASLLVVLESVVSVTHPVGLCLGELRPADTKATTASRAVERRRLTWASLHLLGLKLKRNTLCLVGKRAARAEDGDRLSLIDATGRVFHAVLPGLGPTLSRLLD